MKSDAFSNRHPAVNFIFFLGAICCAAVIQHPAFVAVGLAGGASYFLMLYGRKGLRRIATMIPFFLFLTAINPLLNTNGTNVLFSCFGRPYTLEALLYGAAVAGTFMEMVLWFGCYSAVLTGDKFTALFGNLTPALSLLLVMVLRLIPSFLRKTVQISGARKSIGKGTEQEDTARKKLDDGMAILGALTSWALESSVVTADSMRSRGYGTGKRSSFLLYSMTAGDWGLLAWLTAMLAVAIAMGDMTATFTPEMAIAPVCGKNSVALMAYGLYLYLPTVLQAKETVQWRISRSKI